VSCAADIYGAPCPCANNGDPDHGCGNSTNPLGAALTVSGFASVSSDTASLDGTGMPNSTCQYFQGTISTNSDFGFPFGDGERCVSGSIRRFKAKANSAGASSYPIGTDAPISVAGAVNPGDVRYYQAWYRNPASFCSASTFNLTNGVSIVWQP
jgi:hypothetical protein